MDRMPVLFVGHASPMNTLETNGYTEAWRAFGRHLPKPRALLVVPADWCHRRHGDAETADDPRLVDQLARNPGDILKLREHSDLG